MWEKQMEEGQIFIRNRKYDEALKCFQEILDRYEGQEKPYYWAMKHLADLTGYIYGKDYFSAIDLYQKIINEYEGEDGLYEYAQADMAKTYLMGGMDMISTYEDMESFLQPMNPEMNDYIGKIHEAKEDFIMERAEKYIKAGFKACYMSSIPLLAKASTA